MCGWVGRGYKGSTGRYGGWSYERILGAGQVENWHHYALVWNEIGIPGVAGGSKKLAVYLDGQLNSQTWWTWHSAEFPPVIGGVLNLIDTHPEITQGSVSIDNLKIYNYAKTDFSDRFVEGSGCLETIYVDIKPGACPNSFNPKSNGVLPVAVLGSEDLNVRTIDPATILLTREGYASGVAPLRWSYEDVATPFEGELCDCHDLDGDGYLDLTLKFKTQKVKGTLELGAEGGNTLPLLITGNLREDSCGVPIQGSDCVKVLEKGK